MKTIVVSENALCADASCLTQFKTKSGALRKDIPNAEKRAVVMRGGIEAIVTTIPVSIRSHPGVKWMDVVTGSFYGSDGKCMTGDIALKDVG